MKFIYIWNKWLAFGCLNYNVQNTNSILAVAHALYPIEENVDIINDRLIKTNETYQEF